MHISNKEFLYTIFGGAWERSHITAFSDDPSDIKQESRAACWAGGFAKDRIARMQERENQYYTISLFHDDNGKAVRRKANFEACYIIVADDVKEKLSVDKMSLLPEPTYKLLTSQNSEQWGWILTTPCFDMQKTINLVDGLIAKGSPQSIDPGMKGVTRYVRLPCGSNTKASRLIDGQPFNCQLLSWRPENTASIEELAATFDIDLNKETLTKSLPTLDDQEARQHPIFDYVTFTGEGNDGWLRIDCLNADKHSSQDVTGAALRVMIDGELQYTCHHGHCQGEVCEEGHKVSKFTGRMAIKYIDEQFFNSTGEFIKHCHSFRNSIRQKYAQQLKDLLEKKTIKKEQETLELEPPLDPFLFDELRYIYLFNDNKFYDTKTGNIVTAQSLDNRYKQQFPGGKASLRCSEAFFYNMDPKLSDADGLIWYPESVEPIPRHKMIINHEGARLANIWRGVHIERKSGDISTWLNHLKYLVPDPFDQRVILDYLACLLQRISKKPQFAIIHTGNPRVGKDMLYTPIVRILGSAADVVKIDDALDGWGNYLKGKKLIIIPEVDKGHEKTIANALKTLIASVASDAETLNIKHEGIIKQYDCRGVILLSNRENAIPIEEKDERYYAVESYVKKQSPEYYTRLADFYENGGVSFIFDYLMKRDISHFNHNALPRLTTPAKKMVTMGLYDYEQDIEELVRQLVAPFDMQVFSVLDLKRELKQLNLKCSNNGLHQALKRLGFISLRGTKKIEGENKASPSFFAEKQHIEKHFATTMCNISKAQIYDYYIMFKYKTRGKTVENTLADVIPIK